MADPTPGTILEARSHRVFLAQGLFAERGLLPMATPDRRMLATDIDVLVSEYGSGFHLTRRHVECKSGGFALVDRILWLNGVRTLLGADSSYLIAADVDLAASDFAHGLDVQLFTSLHLDAWEKSIGIPGDLWPCRSDFATFDAARGRWQRLSGDKAADEAWRFLRTTLAFVEVESWLRPKYRLLNRLFRLLTEIGRQFEGYDTDQALCARYVCSALIVRLSQYLLGVCADVAGIMPTEIDKYLTNRLTFGDQDPAQAMNLTQATVVWMRELLRAKEITVPGDIDAARLHTPPAYASEVVKLVRRLLDQSQEARYLPLAVERMQFGLDTDDKLVRLRAAAGSADSLAALLKAFAARSFKLPNALIAPVRNDLAARYRGAPAKNGGTKHPPVPSDEKTEAQRSKWSGARGKGKPPAARDMSPATTDASVAPLPARETSPPQPSPEAASSEPAPKQPSFLAPTADDKA
jgi:hypothetical protein